MYKVGDIVDVLPYSLVKSGKIADMGIPQDVWEEAYYTNPHTIYHVNNGCFVLEDDIWFWNKMQIKKSENMKLDIDLSDFV